MLTVKLVSSSLSLGALGSLSGELLCFVTLSRRLPRPLPLRPLAPHP